MCLKDKSHSPPCTEAANLSPPALSWRIRNAQARQAVNIPVARQLQKIEAISAKHVKVLNVQRVTSKYKS